MIVATQSNEEVFNEIMKDYLNAFEYSEKKQEKVDHIIKKSTLFPVKVFSFFTSPRKNRWMILWYAKSKEYVGDNSLITCVCIVNSENGKYCYMPSFVNKKQQLIIYTPHFMSRFAERMNIKLTREDLIKRFFTYNSSYVFREVEEPIFKNLSFTNIYGTCKEGVAMGFKSKGDIILFKTFVSYDMLKGEQIETFLKDEKIRQKIHDEHLK